MTMRIATWNLCLGLFHKKDYVRTLLYKKNIDILTLQEAELSPDLQLENLQIKGYSIEVENNNKKRRVAIYIKNSISYKRRVDLEKESLHVIILDVESSPPIRLITIYRTFNPQCGCTPRENFRKQLNIINDATTPSTILLGDFNIDEKQTTSSQLQPEALVSGPRRVNRSSSIHTTCQRNNVGKNNPRTSQELNP